MSRATFLRGSLILGLASSSVALYLLADLIGSRRATVRHAREAARQNALTAAASIDATLQGFEAIVHRLAEQASSEGPGAPATTDRIARLREENPSIRDLGVGDSTHDVGWSEPVWDDREQTMLATYSTPIVGEGARAAKTLEDEEAPSPVAYIRISMEPVREAIRDLQLGRTGYGIVLSRQGRFLVHPSAQLVAGRIVATEMTESVGDSLLTQTAESAMRGESGFVDHVNLLNGQSSWFVYEPVARAGWSLFVVRIKDEILTLGQSFRRRVIWISIFSAVGLMGIAVWLLSPWYGERTHAALWILSALLSLSLLAASSAVRWVVYHQEPEGAEDRVTILDATGLDLFLDSQEEAFGERGQAAPSYVPTGVSVQSMKFVTPRELAATGYVWQKFTEAARLAELPRGVEFPNAVDATFTEAYRSLEDGVETVGWYFRATLRQNLDIRRYPFDHGTLSFRLWSKDFDRRVLLTPDLGSYTLTNPAALPGLDGEVVLPGWHISRSYFDYDMLSHETDFGIGLDDEAYPELSYRVGLKRNLINVAVRNVIPMLVVIVMLFSVIVTCTRDEDEASLLDFRPSGVMRVTSALFFVVLLAHIHLRDSLQIQEVTFIEYIYFGVYLLLVLTTLHAFAFSLERFRVRIVEYEESLLVKVAFWPLSIGFLYVVAIAFFY